MSKRETIATLEDGLRIDEHALENECRDQPERFYRVAKALTLAMAQLDAAKMLVTDTEAAADQRIRKSKEKTTEKEVDSLKKLDKQVIEANDEVLHLRQRVGTLQSLKEAYNQRASMLKQLVELYTTNYYGGSEISSDRVKDVRAERTREARRRGT